MPKYTQMGDPLDMLVEECAEVIQEVMKLKRFGAEGDPAWLNIDKKNKPPRDNIIKELGDLLEIIDMMLCKKTIDITYEELLSAQKVKRQRLYELFGYVPNKIGAV